MCVRRSNMPRAQIPLQNPVALRDPISTGYVPAVRVSAEAMNAPLEICRQASSVLPSPVSLMMRIEKEIEALGCANTPCRIHSHSGIYGWMKARGAPPDLLGGMIIAML